MLILQSGMNDGQKNDSNEVTHHKQYVYNETPNNNNF